MTIKPDSHLQVGEWQYLPEQDKLVQFGPDGKVAVTAELDNLSQKVANYFIVKAGKLVTKDELLQDVWGIRDVSDGRVTRVIRVLRVALGDDTREPRYIETIPKRGYRFIAPVSEITPDVNVELTVGQKAPAAPAKISFNKAIIITVLASLIVISSLVSWLLFWDDSDNSEAVTPLLRYVPVTSMDGLEFYHNVSEDERYLLYSYASPINENVAVLIIEDMLEHKRIQITEDTYSSFGAAFSPDVNQIAYHRYYPDGRCSIRLANFDRQAFAVSDDVELIKCGDNSPSSRVAWSPDSKYLIYPTMSATKQMVLMMKPLSGGAAEQLTTPPPSSIGDYAARFSFSGDKLAFVRGSGNSAQLWMLNLTNRELNMLVNVTGTLPGNIGWSADDRYVIYSSSPTTINKVEVDSGKITQVAFTDYGTQEIQTLKNNKLYASVGNFAHVNIKEISNTLRSTEKINRVVFSSNRNETYAEANPKKNGPTAVVSRRSGLPQVWLFYPDGNQKQLTYFEKNERIRDLVFSPDGKKLIVQLHNQLWLLSDDGRLTKIPQREDVIVASPSWGVSGEYVFFAESINGRWQIARFDVARAITDSSPFAIDQELYIESYDGTFSFWRDAISKKFFIKQLNSGNVKEVPVSLPRNQLWTKFQAKSSGIYYAELIDNIYYSLKHYDVENGEISNVTEEQVLYHSRFSVSEDEKRVFILESVRGDIDIAKLELP